MRRLIRQDKQEEVKITPEEIEKIKELDSVTYSNMAEIYLQQGKYKKATEKATLVSNAYHILQSIASKESGKAYFRRGKALVRSKDCTGGIEDLKKAKLFMPEQAPIIDAEIKQAEELEKEYSKTQFKKYAGFFDKLGKE